MGEKRIGIFGGTFNPVHHGHLITARAVKESFQLDCIILIPSGTPPHKPGITKPDGRDRYKMLCRAVEADSDFEVSSMEIERAGTTYTVDTLEQLRGIYPPETQLFFMIGADVVHELETWKDHEKVFRLCEFIAMLRPGYEKKEFLDTAEKLRTRYGAKVHIADIPQIEISSTGIRERAAQGRNIAYLVPQGVAEYIKEMELYQGN